MNLGGTTSTILKDYFRQLQTSMMDNKHKMRLCIKDHCECYNSGTIFDLKECVSASKLKRQYSKRIRNQRLRMMEGKLEKRSLARVLKFCLWMIISILLSFHLNYCHGLQHQQTAFNLHKTSGIILGDASAGISDSNIIGRRNILRRCVGSAIAAGLVSSSPRTAVASTTPNQSTIIHPFVYSDTWQGTNLKIMSLEESITPAAYSRDETSGTLYWSMGKWPDPALRVPATPIRRSDPDQLQLTATILRNTARREGAVGLAAQQCGVDGRMVYLSGGSSSRDMVLVNPRIVNRSPESSMKVWTEECLVLPPTFRATVLRDEWIDVEYDFSYEYSSNGNDQTPRLLSTLPLSDAFDLSSATPIVKRFYKEQSRCLQHELDHDRGILITDHVGLDELETDVMRTIETKDHDRRQALAYSRE